MKTIVCERPGRFQIKPQANPVLSKNHSIIQINRIGICGTDLHAFEGTQPYFEYPRILGHEISGTLVELDNAPGFQKGESVTVLPYFNCKECIACRTGKPNCCVNMKVCGVHVDGGMVERLSVASDFLVHGDGLSFDELALVEPLAIGAHGVRRANVEAGEYVLVVGAGPIGLGTMEFARLAGGRVIALDLNTQRLKFCRDNNIAEFIINSSDADVHGNLREITNGDMPSVIIDATGNLKAINNSFQYLAHGGRYVLIGLQKGDISINHPEFHKRESTLMSSRNATRQDFEFVINMLKSGSIKPLTYITHRVSFVDMISEFDSWLRPSTGVIKAMVEIT